MTQEKSVVYFMPAVNKEIMDKIGLFCIQKYSVYEWLHGEAVQCPLLEVTQQTSGKTDTSTLSLLSLEE